MSSITYRGHNSRLVYRQSGAHIAELRCRQLSIAYSVSAEESHARSKRAFYPHQRVQGSFTMTFEFIGWHEYNKGMRWFRNYFDAMLGWKDPSPMMARMDVRNFVRLGIPTTGVGFGDHTASMVFSPSITFVSVSDPNDPKTKILDRDQVSNADLSSGQISSRWFYPDSTLQRPGSLQKYIYDRAQEAAAERAQGVANQVTGGRAYY